MAMYIHRRVLTVKEFIIQRVELLKRNQLYVHLKSREWKGEGKKEIIGFINQICENVVK